MIRYHLKTFRPTVVIRTRSLLRFVLLAAHALSHESYFILCISCIGRSVRKTRQLIVPKIVWDREPRADQVPDTGRRR